MELKAFNLEDPREMEIFLRGDAREISVPGTHRTVMYDPLKRVGVGTVAPRHQPRRLDRGLRLCSARIGQSVIRGNSADPFRGLGHKGPGGLGRLPARSHPAKGTGGETRPIGIPTLEDKVLQRAIVMLLEPIYEQGFYDCSYGFRPQRSAHAALDSLSKQTMWSGVSCILEVDIRKFFDTLDHAHLRAFLQQRVRDGVVLRLIGKWLNAGVLEDGAVTHPEAGSPQGGVISPLLANVYLHYVLDDWLAREVQPRLRGARM